MKIFARFIILVFLASGCDVSNNKPLTESSFTIIFENNNSGNDYFPLDIKQTADKGYLILAEMQNTSSDFPLVYVIKTDDKGKVLWEKTSDKFVSPASQLIENGTDFAIICMENNGFSTQFIKADENLSLISEIPNLIYPLAAQKVSAGMALLSYDFADGHQTKLSILNASGGVISTQKYEFSEDVKERIIVNHLQRRGKRLPFFVGESSSGNYYFNGITDDFSLSMLFANKPGKITGVRYESAINSIFPLSNTKFAISIFDVAGNIRFLPQQNVEQTEIKSVKDYVGTTLQELIPFSPVLFKKASLNGKNVFLLNATTKNGQAVLSCYDENSGSFIGSNYYGSGTKTEMGNVIQTADGGLAILVKNYVAGRFGRLMLFKITKKQAEELGGLKVE